MLPIAFLSAFIVLGVIFLVLPRTILSVREGIAGRELAMFPIGSGSWLKVDYVHSLYGVRQSEVFSVDGKPAFRLEKVVFGSLAAALYYDPDPPSGLTFQDNLWVINGDGKCYPVLKYRVGTATHHLLKVMNQTIDLSGLFAGTDGLIQMEIEKRSRLCSIFIGIRKKVVDALK